MDDFFVTDTFWVVAYLLLGVLVHTAKLRGSREMTQEMFSPEARSREREESGQREEREGPGLPALLLGKFHSRLCQISIGQTYFWTPCPLAI